MRESTRRSALVNVMCGAAVKAARALRRDFGEVEQLQVSRKGPADFVSAADRKAEKVVAEELRRVRPHYGLLLEEAGEIPGEDKQNRWIVDPLDGTTNFLHGIPHFAISIGLERHGNLVAGVVFNPVTDEMFWAEHGHGAYLNDRRIRVSARRELDDALLATGIPHAGKQDHGEFGDILGAVMPRVAGVRRFGAAALDLAYVAAGRFDGFWERGLSPWDVAAGIVLVREAGGYVSDFADRKDCLYGGSIVAANDQLHRPLRALIARASAPSAAASPAPATA